MLERLNGRAAGLVLAALLTTALAGCATPKFDVAVGPTAPHGAPPPASVTTPTTPLPGPMPTPGHFMSFADLPGWADEDHAAALKAFQDGCGAASDAALRTVCYRARTLGEASEDRARLFLEANFRPQPVADTTGKGSGLLTAYFAPSYEARASKGGEFTAPVRARPADLVILDLGQFEPTFAGKKVTGHVVGGKFVPYGDRAAIEAEPPAEKPLAWMRAEDLFFLQIQGSGVLTFPDGTRKKALFAAGNGKPFVGIASVMRDQGLLPDNDTSGEAIRQWLADHRGEEAQAVMRKNPRYIFFRLAPDDGKEPAGAAGVALTPGRAIAVDPSKHAMGSLYWIDASAPVLNGAFPAYRRLAVALDTGGAIKGDVRADLYTGTGQAAGVEAGRVRHALRMYELVPTPTAGS